MHRLRGRHLLPLPPAPRRTAAALERVWNEDGARAYVSGPLSGPQLTAVPGPSPLARNWNTYIRARVDIRATGK